MGDLTGYLADFIVLTQPSDLSPEAVENIKGAICDYAAVLLAGASSEVASQVRDVALTMGGVRQASIWGSGRKTSVAWAAMANASSAHAIEFDDTNPVMISHPSIQLLPGLFALGELTGNSGSEVIMAYAVGFEVGAKISRALNPMMVAGGWFPVGIVGPVMQAAACARLVQLSADETRRALGLAMNTASGLRCNSGYSAKSVIAGHGAFNAVMSVLLAREGVSANPDALADRFGYFDNLTHGNLDDLERIIRSLGSHWDLLESGIHCKRYPCCGGAHMAIDAALEIAGKYPIDIDKVEKVVVSIRAGTRYVLIHPRPTTADEARFSLEYCVARALIDGTMGTEQFSDDKINAVQARCLIERVIPDYYEVSKEDRSAYHKPQPVRISVHMINGEVLSACVTGMESTSDDEARRKVLRNKFADCSKSRLSPRRMQKALHMISRFEQIEDINEFVRLLHPGVKGRRHAAMNG